MIQAEISLAGVYADKTIRLEADTYWAVHDQFEAYVSLMYGEMAADNAQNLFLNLFAKQLEAEITGIQEKITEPLDRIFSVVDQVLLQLEIQVAGLMLVLFE